MPTRNFIVSAIDPTAEEMDALVVRLRDAGLDVTQQLGAVGLILGTADEDAIEALRAVPGVAVVEEARVVESRAAVDEGQE